MRLLRSSRNRPFHDRTDAGQQVAALLTPMFAAEPGQSRIVLGLARGGIPVAAPIASRLDAELDACVVRKIGAPAQPELAIGAIAPGDVRVLNRTLIRDLALSDAAVDELSMAASRERNRVEAGIRGEAPPPTLGERIVVLVDDGLATGASMQAAVAWAEALQPHRVIVAVPVTPPRLVEEFRRAGIEVAAVLQSTTFGSVGQFYDDFSEVTTDQARAILAQGQRDAS